jgi:hypothetical protein
MSIVYAWPPVGSAVYEWTVEDPVSVSRSALTGRRYASAHARRRRLVTLSVPARQKDDSGWRYMEAMKRILRGGANYVRLCERQVSRHVAAQGRDRGLAWTSGGEDLAWTSGAGALSWRYDLSFPALLSAVGAEPAVKLTGLTAGVRYADAGERLAIGGHVRTTLGPIVGDAAGACTVRLDEAFPAGGQAIIGASETGIFEVLEMPRAARPVGQGYGFDWSFREVFADEIGLHSERDPWR